MNDADKKAMVVLLRNHVGSIVEHVDSVQIIVTKTEGGTTTCFSEGAGNWYARVQSCREFVMEDQARTHFSEAPKPPPDDSDDWKAGK